MPLIEECAVIFIPVHASTAEKSLDTEKLVIYKDVGTRHWVKNKN